MADTWYRVITSGACFAIVERDGVCVNAAPIAKRSIGRDLSSVFEYMINVYGASIEKL